MYSKRDFAACLWQVKVYTCVCVIIIAVEMLLYLKCRRPFYHEAICTVHHYLGTLVMMAQLYTSSPDRFLWHWLQMQALKWRWVLPDLHSEGRYVVKFTTIKRSLKPSSFLEMGRTLICCQAILGYAGQLESFE